jgi:hypothetical protein
MVNIYIGCNNAILGTNQVQLYDNVSGLHLGYTRFMYQKFKLNILVELFPHHVHNTCISLIDWSMLYNPIQCYYFLEEITQTLGIFFAIYRTLSFTNMFTTAP